MHEWAQSGFVLRPLAIWCSFFGWGATPFLNLMQFISWLTHRKHRIHPNWAHCQRSASATPRRQVFLRSHTWIFLIEPCGTDFCALFMRPLVDSGQSQNGLRPIWHTYARNSADTRWLKGYKYQSLLSFLCALLGPVRLDDIATHILWTKCTGYFARLKIPISSPSPSQNLSSHSYSWSRKCVTRTFEFVEAAVGGGMKWYDAFGGIV